MNKPSKRFTVSTGGPPLAFIFLFGCAGGAYQDAPVSLEVAIQHATTKADHHALAAYYYEEARLFQVDATWHERIAKVYGTTTYPKAKEEAMQRYDALARRFREIAEEHLALARIHRQLAEQAPQNDVWPKEMGARWVQRPPATVMIGVPLIQRPPPRVPSGAVSVIRTPSRRKGS